MQGQGRGRALECSMLRRKSIITGLPASCTIEFLLTAINIPCT